MDSSNNPLQQIFLAGVGALAIGVEKSQEIINELVEKGQITVEQGKDIASDLSSRTEEDMSKVRDQIINAHLKSMTKEQRDEFAAKIADMAAQIDTDSELEVEEEAEIKAAKQLKNLQIFFASFFRV